MITDLKYEFIADISRENGMLAVPGLNFSIAAGVWRVLRQGRLVDAKLACLHHVMEQLSGRESEWERWIVVGHRAFQPDNRIVRYYGLYRALQRRGIGLPDWNLVEQVHECEQGLRYVCAVRWDLSDIESVHAAMRDEQAVIILAQRARAEAIVTDIVYRGWCTSHEKPPLAVLEVAVREPIVVIEIYGEFDDREIAVAAFGRVDILRSLGLASRS